MSASKDKCKGNCKNNEKKMEELRNVIESYKQVDGALIGVLHKSQQIFGYLPKEVLYEISREMNVPISEVMGVVTFYSFFSTVPKGKHNIMVCMGTACYVRGAEHVLEAYKKELGIDLKGTTEDHLFSLDQARCFGACGLAPAVDISGKVHKQVTPEIVKDIIKQYKKAEGV